MILGEGRAGKDGRRLDGGADGGAKCGGRGDFCDGQVIFGIVGTVSPDMMATCRDSTICLKEGRCHVKSDSLTRQENLVSLSGSHCFQSCGAAVAAGRCAAFGLDSAVVK